MGALLRYRPGTFERSPSLSDAAPDMKKHPGVSTTVSLVVCVGELSRSAPCSKHGLPVAPSTYYEHLGKSPSPRQRRDEYLLEHTHEAHVANYGACKVWLALNREGI